MRTDNPLELLFRALKPSKTTSIITHNNPDPDALASAMGLRFLLKKQGYKRVRIFYNGLIGRPENQAMVNILEIPLFRTGNITTFKNRQFILVDCQPGAANVTLPEKAMLAAVVDHHPQKKGISRIPFNDIRPEYGSCATIITEYFLENGIPMPQDVSTALAYGISSETQNLGREGSPADRRAYKELLTDVSFGLLARIQYPKISKDFVFHLSDALGRVVFYKNLIGVLLDQLPYPDFVAEMADFLLRVRNMTWSICLGDYQGTLFISVRTSNTKSDASRIIKKIVPKRGTAGGHSMIAGAQIDVAGMDQEELHSLKKEVMFKMLHALNHRNATELFRLVSDQKFSLK